MFRRFACSLIALSCALAPSMANAQTQSVTITWDANTEPDVLGYLVYVGTAPGVYATVFDAGPSTEFTFNNGVAGQRYYFAVSAYAAGPLEGARSSEVSTVIGGTAADAGSGTASGGGSGGGTSGGGSGATPPGVPAPAPPAPVLPGVALAPALVSGDVVTLAWTPIGGLTAREYWLEAGTAPGLSNLYNASVGATTTLSAQVGPGAYYVRVRGRQFDDTITTPSNEISFSVGVDGQAGCSAPPAPPTGLDGATGGGQASLRWLAAAGATSYLVQAGSAPGLSDVYYGNVGGTTAVSAQVAAGFSAYVRVVAVNACGQSAASAEILLQ